jgi:hypothetical protein
MYKEHLSNSLFLSRNQHMSIEAMLSLDRPRQPTAIHDGNVKLPQFLCSQATSICEALEWFAYSNLVFLSLASLFLANQTLSEKGNVCFRLLNHPPWSMVARQIKCVT